MAKKSITVGPSGDGKWNVDRGKTTVAQRNQSPDRNQTRATSFQWQLRALRQTGILRGAREPTDPSHRRGADAGWVSALRDI